MTDYACDISGDGELWMEASSFGSSANGFQLGLAQREELISVHSAKGLDDGIWEAFCPEPSLDFRRGWGPIDVHFGRLLDLNRMALLTEQVEDVLQLGMHQILTLG